METPFHTTDEIPKEYSLEAKRESAKRAKRAKVHVLLNNGVELIGHFYLNKGTRPSDYLRNGDVDRLLLTDVKYNKKSLNAPVMVILSNCQFIALLDNHIPIEDRG